MGRVISNACPVPTVSRINTPLMQMAIGGDLRSLGSGMQCAASLGLLQRKRRQTDTTCLCVCLLNWHAVFDMRHGSLQSGYRLVHTIYHLSYIVSLHYWVLPNIFQYWVVLGIGQYFYWLSYPIPILLGHLDSSCLQGNWGGGKVKLESLQIKELKIKDNKQWN